MAQGGTRVPAIISHSSIFKPGRVDEQYLTVRDLAPTLLDVAGAAHPYREGSQEVLPMTGRSFVSVLGSGAELVHPEDESVGWEMHNNKALVRGDWKVVVNYASYDTRQWGLYNLREDPSEFNNLAEKYPDLKEELISQWHQYAKKNGVLVATDSQIKSIKEFK